MHKLAKSVLMVAQNIRKDIPRNYVPPSEGSIPSSQMILPHALMKNTRGYLEKIVYQINGTYENGWYDACAVMIRKLVESLIIEIFEKNDIESRIKNSSDNYFYLGDLIKKTLNENKWNLTRNTKHALPKLKDVGDLSAHSRTYNAYREDIDKIIPHLRVVTQELIYIAKLK